MENCHIKEKTNDTDRTTWFSQVVCSRKIELPLNLPDIEEIISAISVAEILSVRTINTVSGLSFEGQHLTGKKAAIEIKIRIKVLYSSSQNEKTVHIFESSFFQMVYIVIPKLIEGTNPELLFDNKNLVTELHVLNDFTRQLHHHSFLKNISLYTCIFHGKNKVFT